MKISRFKQKVIQILFILAVLTVVANIIAAKISVKPGKEKLENIGTNTVNVKFLGALNDFGLQKKWITTLKGKRSGEADYVYSVDVPKDLPIPVILSEIYGTFNTTNVKLKCIEKELGGETTLNILSDNATVLKADFNYNNNIFRNAGSVGILVKDLDLLKKKDMDALIEFPQTFAAVLLPSKNSTSIRDSLLNNRKEYALLLNDDIKDINYKLNKNFSRNRLKLAIRSIIGAFPDAIFYVIDDNSNLYNSAVYSFIKNELLKRKINLVKESSFIQIEEGSREDVSMQLRNIVTPTKTGDQKLLLIHADDFELSRPEIFSLIKVGYKFINPSIIMSNKNKKANPGN